jgi:hypothetical protein
MGPAMLVGKHKTFARYTKILSVEVILPEYMLKI